MTQFMRPCSTMYRSLFDGCKALVGWGLLGLMLAGLLACGQSTKPVESELPAVEAGQAAEVELIPRRQVFGNPDRTQAHISPDGKTLSWLAPRNGVLNVFVAPVQAPEKARAITNDSVRGIRQHYWSRSGSHVLYLQDKGGNENDHVYGEHQNVWGTLDRSIYTG